MVTGSVLGVLTATVAVIARLEAVQREAQPGAVWVYLVLLLGGLGALLGGVVAVLAEGRSDGRAEGRAQGRAEGRAEGRRRS